MIHVSKIVNKPKAIEYWRNPTLEEIKFGHGAIHFRMFDFNNCIDENGYVKKVIKSPDDGLKYYY